MLENGLGETEPESVTDSATGVTGYNVSSLALAHDTVLEIEGEYLGTEPFSPLPLGMVSRKICSKSVFCINANCSAAFNILDVIKTSISGCNQIYFMQLN